MTKPTYQDATLLLQLAEWQMSSEVAAALRWLWSDRFALDCADSNRVHSYNSEDDRRATVICEYFDTIGALYKHGLVNEDLLFDWVEAAPVWDRIKGYVLARRRDGKPLWVHFEALATAHKRRTGEYST